jgi:GNAT superfamily N-acetyltransferase
MTLNPIGIRRARDEDAGPIIDTLAAAFSEGPVAEWLLPDAADRVAAFRAYAEVLYVQTVAAGGFIDVIGSLTAAAVWYLVPAQPDPDAEHGDTGDDDGVLAKSFGVVGMARLIALEDTLRSHSPTTGPHHTLAFLGVRPERQQRGLGTLLLSHRLLRLDAEGAAAFLIATSIRSRKLYLGHGFQVCEQFSAGDGGPDLWSMRREPQPVQRQEEQAGGAGQY